MYARTSDLKAADPVWNSGGRVELACLSGAAAPRSVAAAAKFD
ncbi:MAG: hypothetical protein ACOYM2_00595 [Rectinemataceae bacterium]